MHINAARNIPESFGQKSCWALTQSGKQHLEGMSFCNKKDSVENSK